MKVTLEEQKEIMLEILDSIDVFCKQNGIKYYLYGGTLIGAIRHKGFIPWDDDIDICMFREDYEKFVDSYSDENGLFEILSPKNNKLYYLPMAKVIDKRTEMEEQVSSGVKIGVYVDVFPIDNLPGDYKESCKYAKKIRLLSKIITIKNTSLSKDRTVGKNIVLFFLKLFVLFYPRRKAINKINKKASKYLEDKDIKYIGELVLNPYGEREIYEKKWFDYTYEVEFEGKKYWGPGQYDEVLKKCYGDYMKLPPVEKQVTHHRNEIRWK